MNEGDNIKALIEQNLLDFLRLTADTNDSVHMLEDVIYTNIESPSSSWPNFSFLNGKEPSSEHLNSGYNFQPKIENQQVRFWLNGSESIGKLSETQLEQLGFIPVGQWPLMALDRKSLETNFEFQESWQLHQLNKNDLQAWIELAQTGFGPLQEEIFHSLYDQDEVTFLSLKKEGEIIACMLVFMQNDIAGFYYLVTNTQFRNHGLGTKLVNIGIQAALENGCKYVVAQLSESGFPLLQKMGFKTYGLIDIFMIP